MIIVWGRRKRVHGTLHQTIKARWILTIIQRAASESEQVAKTMENRVSIIQEWK